MVEAPHDTIRRAAALMRDRAAAATSGRWESITLPEWDFYEVRADQSPPARPRTEYRWIGSDVHERADAEHIAGMHPGVALLIADQWDAAAREMAHWSAYEDEHGRVLQCLVGVRDEWTATLAAARAYLGERP